MIRKLKTLFAMILPGGHLDGLRTPLTRAVRLVFHRQLLRIHSFFRALRFQILNRKTLCPFVR